MPGNDVSLGAARHRKDGVFGALFFLYCLGMVCRAKDHATKLGPAVYVGSN